MKRNLLTSLTIFVVLLLAFNFLVRWAIRQRYLEIVKNPSLVNQIDHQVWKNGQLLTTTNPSLPQYHLISIKSFLAPGVLAASTDQDLSRLEPATRLINGRITAVFPINNEETGETTVVFTPIFP